jgi:V8-like Glu-specific endopeptidase
MIEFTLPVPFVIFPLLVGFGVACQTGGPDLTVQEGLASADAKIINGDAPDSPEHDAVVALHQIIGGAFVASSPFCSGTLIAEDVVLTAGHCVESGGGVLSASRVAVYVGDDPSSDLADHTYTVASVEQHPDYSSSSLTGDIALLILDSPVTEAAPVPHLPTSQGFTSADEGSMLNFAGFGTSETNSYGVKLQTDVALKTVWASQLYYLQSTSIGGPCTGDSGGPAFVDRSGTAYVGGVTSYGDRFCRFYGVSTRVDSYASWIEGFVTTPPADTGMDTGMDTGADTGVDTAVDTGTPADPCDGFDTTYTGSLSGTGVYDVHPDDVGYYQTSSPGKHDASLSGPSGADFDLYLYRYAAGSWIVWASSTGSDSDESISQGGPAGFYAWIVSSADGSGDYTACTTTP